MRIIKKGIRSTMQVVCEKCEAELEINAGDLKKEPDDNSGLGAYYYTCPCCNSTQYRLFNEVAPQIRVEFSKLNS